MGRSAAGALTTGFSATGGVAAGGCTATGGACGFAGAGAGGFATAAGRGGGVGCSDSCCRCLSSRITSPGLEILERSILGLISDCADLSLEAAPDFAAKCFLIFSASSGSTELE